MKTLILSSVIFAAVFSVGCTCCKHSEKTKTDATQTKPVKESATSRNFLKEGFTLATVIDYSEISGCNYLLMLEDESKLQPKNLTEEFKKPDLKVWVKYKTENTPTVCMAGKVISLIEIVKR